MTSNGRREQGKGDPSKGDLGFGILDPQLRSPGYWARLRGNVMERAANELYRRRLLRSVGVADLLQSWARMLVPAAVVAAATAAAAADRVAPASLGATKSGKE